MNSLAITALSYLEGDNGYNISLVLLQRVRLQGAFDVRTPQAINQFITRLFSLYLIYKHDALGRVVVFINQWPEGVMFINQMQTSYCYNMDGAGLGAFRMICTDNLRKWG